MALRAQHAAQQPLAGARIMGSPAHDGADRGADRDAGRPRRRRALGVVQHLLDAGHAPPPRSRSAATARVAEPAGHRRLRLEGRDARGVLVVHERGARVARRLRARPDRRRRRRRDAARAQGPRVREGRQACPAFDADNDPEEWGVILDLLAPRCSARTRAAGTRIAPRIRGVSEETTTGVHRLYEMAKNGHAALPGHQRQRLGHQEQVRQHLRLPPLADRRPQPRHRRHARRQGRRRLRLRRGRQGLRRRRCAARAAASSSPRSIRSARCRRRWRATRSTTLEDVVETRRHLHHRDRQPRHHHRRRTWRG